MKKVTVSTLLNKKINGEKFATITAYDASFAKIFEDAGIDMILVGDSMGMVLQGHDDTVPVTVEQVAYHTRCVRAGASKPLLVADMPFMSYATREQAFATATTLMQAGASMVKLEGGEWLTETISGLVERGVPVCGHLGLTPQSVNVFGGFKIQGRSEDAAQKLVDDAIALQNAGVQLLVLECIPTPLAEKVTQALSIPVIGIGAGPVTDGQILVMHDVLGISAGFIPKFSKNYIEGAGDIRQAVENYVAEVQSGAFPTEAHSFAK